MDCMSDKLRKNIFLLVIGSLLICVMGVILEAQLKVVRRAYDNFLLDNRNHYLSCKDLPTKVEVESVMEKPLRGLSGLRLILQLAREKQTCLFGMGPMSKELRLKKS
jgi:hypothetical protein